MKLQVSGWYVNLSLGINTTINTNGRTPVCTFLQYFASCARTRSQTYCKVPCENVYIFRNLSGGYVCGRPIPLFPLIRSQAQQEVAMSEL